MHSDSVISENNITSHMTQKPRLFGQIGLHFLLQTVWVHLQPLRCNWLPKLLSWVKLGKNNGHYAIPGHSRSPFLVLMKSPYATWY